MTASKHKQADRKTAENGRAIKQPAYKSFRLSRQLVHVAPELLSSRSLLRNSVGLLWVNKRFFGGIIVIYGLLQILLVQGILAQDFSTTVSIVQESLQGQWQELLGSVTLFTYLLGSSGQSVSGEGSVYQSMLLIIVSLALIWGLRHTYAGTKVRIRDSYYKGMYPLIPFLLVLLVVLVQLLPLLIGAWVYQSVMNMGVATYGIESLFWFGVMGMFALLTFYMLCSSIIALYVVTLPDVTPIQALRSAGNLVKYRRRAVFWRLFVLSLMCMLALAITIVPIIIIWSPAAPWAFYFMTIILVAITHSYLYALYRELLQDA